MSEWISVYERLPKIGEEIMTYGLVYKSVSGVKVRVYYPDLLSGIITHWMPLPEPPK